MKFCWEQVYVPFSENTSNEITLEKVNLNKNTLHTMFWAEVNLYVNVSWIKCNSLYRIMLESFEQLTGSVHFYFRILRVKAPECSMQKLFKLKTRFNRTVQKYYFLTTLTKWVLHVDLICSKDSKHFHKEQHGNGDCELEEFEIYRRQNLAWKRFQIRCI